jgi:iron complex transport system ATP-binding protein
MSGLLVSGLEVRIAERVICQGLDLQLAAGQSWGLLGGNGSGKTTLLHTLAGLRPPAAGQIYLFEEDLAGMPRRQVARLLGLLLQDSSDPFPATVLETALLGRHPHLSRWQWEGDEDYRIAEQALKGVGLAALSGRMIDTLSGGERRRLAIATLLIQQTPVMLLDEPTNHLDPFYQMQLLNLLAGLLTEPSAEGRQPGMLMMSLHDINLAARFCSHLLLLLPDGEVLSGSCAELLNVEVLTRLYRHPMMCVEGDAGIAFLPR